MFRQHQRHHRDMPGMLGGIFVSVRGRNQTLAQNILELIQLGQETELLIEPLIHGVIQTERAPRGNAYDMMSPSSQLCVPAGGFVGGSGNGCGTRSLGLPIPSTLARVE